MLLEVIFSLLLALIGIASILPMLERGLHFAAKIKAKSIEAPDCGVIANRNAYLLEECEVTDTKEKSFALSKKEHGFGLSETLVSISLALIIIAALAKSYAIAGFHSKTLQSWIREEEVAARVESEIIRLFKASDSHPFSPGPKLHHNGRIALNDGTPNAVMYGSTRLKPSSQSTAITNFKLDMKLLSDIKTCTISGDTHFGKACLRYLSSGATSKYQSFVLISVDGIYEGVGSFSGQARCKDFEITLEKSMLFTSPDSLNSCTQRLLIPLEYLQTIYYSEGQDFRLLSHRTISNVENQPLTLAYPGLRLSLNPGSGHSPNQLELRLYKDIKVLSDRIILSSLGRQSAINFMFNYL